MVDWVYFILYLFAYPQYSEHLYLVCRTRLLRTGTIQDELYNKDKFILLVSSGRMTLHDTLKIARQLRCSIRVVGIDYKRCNLFIGAPKSSNVGYKKIQEKIINGLKQIAPACASKARFLGRKGDLYPATELSAWLYTTVILLFNFFYRQHIACIALSLLMFLIMGQRYLQCIVVEAMMFLSVVCGFISYITPAIISSIFLLLNCITSNRYNGVLSYYYLTLVLVSIYNI